MMIIDLHFIVYELCLEMLCCESHLSCIVWSCLHFLFRVYGQAFINLFYSSPPLFPFPWKKRFVGRNVRAISVSVPFFPCVNALPSKNTASLFIYCVRRWVLSFSPLFMDKSVQYVSLWERVRWWWIVGGPRVRDWMSEQTERERTWTQVWKELFVRLKIAKKKKERKKKQDDCKMWEEPVWASVNSSSMFSVTLSDGHSLFLFPFWSISFSSFSHIIKLI